MKDTLLALLTTFKFLYRILNVETGIHDAKSGDVGAGPRPLPFPCVVSYYIAVGTKFGHFLFPNVFY
jgi:hypothetical protein